MSVEVCNFVLKHPFYFYDDNPSFLMGFDSITRAALTIHSESRCVWSKYTLRCHISQDLANSCAKPTIQVSADSFLKTVPPVCLPFSEIDDVEEVRTEDFRHDEVSDPLSMVHYIPEFPKLYESVVNISEVHESNMLSTSFSEFSLSKTIEVGVQASESVLSERFENKLSSIHEEPLSESARNLSFTINSRASTPAPEQSVSLCEESGHESSSTSVSLNPRAPVFVPEQPVDVCIGHDTQSLVDSRHDTSLVTSMTEPVSSIWTMKSLFESPNIDDDVTLLKTKSILAAPKPKR